MTRKILVGALLCISTTASADNLVELSISQFNPADAVAPISIVQGPGVKIGEGTVIHPVFGIETGFVSNVFYDENAKPAGMLRLLGQVGLASLGEMRLNPNAPGTTEDDADKVDKGSFQYEANVRLAYDQPLSTNDVVMDTGGLGVGARFRGYINPMSKVTFGFDEDFLRTIRASNFETSENVNRDVNVLKLMVLFHPPARTLSGYLYYKNTIDIFENQQDLYPNRIDHRIGLHPTYQWLPKTLLYGDFSIGILRPLGDSVGSMNKIDSYPMILRAGISTLLTLKTTLNVSTGYTNGFYAAGPNFSRPVADAQLTFRYSPLGRLGVLYSYAHVDSVNANYYRDHVAAAFIQQLFVPFAVMIQPQIVFRQYNGVTIMNASSTTRDDFIMQIIGGVHYNFRNWIAATVDYKFSTVQTDFTYVDNAGNTVDLNYIRHELLAGLRIAM